MATIALYNLSDEFMNDKNDNTALREALKYELNLYSIDKCAINNQSNMALVSFYHYNDMKEALKKIEQGNEYSKFGTSIKALTTGHSDYFYFSTFYEPPTDIKKPTPTEIGKHLNHTLDLSGLGAYIQTPNIITGITDLTVEFFVKIPHVGSHNLEQDQRVGILLGNYSVGATDCFGIEVHAKGQGRVYWDGMNVYGLTDLRDDKIHHVAFVRNKSENTWKIFVDGNIDGTHQDCGKDITPKSLFRIGADNRAEKCPYFHGEIGEVRIWTKARTETEIRDNMYSLLKGSEENLLIYYKVDEGSGNTLTNATSNGNNAILINAPSWITR